MQDVRRYRLDYLSGAGPVFALYETAAAGREFSARDEPNAIPPPGNRRLCEVSDGGHSLMFEEALCSAGDPAADPAVGG